MSTSNIGSSNITIGDQFNRAIIQELYYKQKGNRRYLWASCLCTCDNIFECRVADLKRGYTKSCGCLRKEKIIEFSTKHGFRKHPLYQTWNRMIQRCENPNDTNYKNYGGRGITVSEEFHNIETFINYCLDIGLEPGKSVDRINNDGNYERGNLRASTRIEQNNNTRNNIYFTYAGETKTLAEWSRDDRCVVCYHTLTTRLHRGWSFEDALLTPSGQTRLSLTI